MQVLLENRSLEKEFLAKVLYTFKNMINAAEEPCKKIINDLYSLCTLSILSCYIHFSFLQSVAHAFRILHFPDSNEANHIFMFIGHFHAFFYKLVSYPLLVSYFFSILLVIGIIYILW